MIGNIFLILGSELHTLTTNQSPSTFHKRIRDLQTSYYCKLFKFAAIFSGLEAIGKIRKILRFSVNIVCLVNFQDIKNEDGVVSF